MNIFNNAKTEQSIKNELLAEKMFWNGTSVSWGFYNNAIDMAYKQQKFIFHSSGGWKVQD